MANPKRKDVPFILLFLGILWMMLVLGWIITPQNLWNFVIAGSLVTSVTLGILIYISRKGHPASTSESSPPLIFQTPKNLECEEPPCDE